MLVAALGVAPAGAQIMGPVRISREPSMWTSASVGMLAASNVTDGTTASAWNFGTSVQYRASIEWAIANQSGVGILGTFAPMPLSWHDLGGVFATCAGGCDAHADVWSAMAFFHAGGGEGFHQILEISAGAVVYDNFTRDSDDAQLGSGDADMDFALGVSYGFGFGLGPRMQIMLVQDAMQVFHQRENLAGGDDTSGQHYTTRIGIRYGLGSRGRR